MAWDPHACDMASKWQSHAGPRGRLRGMQVAQTRGGATRVHADAGVAPREKRSSWMADDGPTGSWPR